MCFQFFMLGHFAKACISDVDWSDPFRSCGKKEGTAKERNKELKTIFVLGMIGS